MSAFNLIDALADRAAKAEGVSQPQARPAVEEASEVLEWRMGREPPRGRVLRLARLLIHPGKHRRMRRVKVEIDDIMLAGSEGGEVPSIAVTCTRCGESVEIFGQSEASIIRGCATLADDCGEWNFYVHDEASA
jgi:hypothetical protein